MEDDKDMVMPKPFEWEQGYLEKQGDAWEEERTLTMMTDEQWEDFLKNVVKIDELEKENEQEGI